MLALLMILCLAGAAAADDARQIDWVRDVDRALEQSAAERRPLFVAVNMDGESASERIARELYRDPEFVGLTRRAVCLVASAFRHTPRDFDDQGRRIPCPRLGRVTCGEHIALEPVLFERFLGGERIAPRHALLTPEGRKRFDLFLQFDLREVERQLAAAMQAWPEPRAARADSSDAFDTWRRLLWGSREPAAVDQLVATARELGREADAAAEVRRQLRDVPDFDPVEPPPGRLRALARLDGASTATRSLLLAHRVLYAAGPTGREAGEALAGLSAEQARAVDAALEALAETDALRLLLLARGMRLEVGVAPAERPAMASVEELQADLDAALDALRADDASAEVRVGRASLDLARQYMDAGQAGADLLLADAERFLDRALARDPEDPELLLDRARVAFRQGRFDEEERFALKAAALLAEPPCLTRASAPEAAAALADPQRLEVLRWIGDAAARLLSARSGADPVEEAAAIARGGRALLLAAASPRGDETDWLSAASFLGALGLLRLEVAWLDEGLRRFPESNDLRGPMNRALWSAGRPELLVRHAERILASHPDSAACEWYVGYARVLLGDWRRRQEAPEDALAEYHLAELAFERCAGRAPEFAPSCTHYRALCAQSRGFAHLLADRQSEAARGLVQAVATSPEVITARDGLDRETLDLIDGCLEWRERGPSPVDPLALLHELEQAAPEDAFWARAVSDSELREALRAEGRGDDAAVEGYLGRALSAGRRAVELADDPDSRHVCAQAATVLAERHLARGQAEAALPLLREAAALLDLEPDEDPAGSSVEALARQLRERLGERSPIPRPGR